MVILVLAGLVLSVLPLVLLAGITLSSGLGDDLIHLLDRPWLLAGCGIAGIVIFGLVLTGALLLHAWVAGGTVAIYLQGERSGQTALTSSFRRFSVDAWMAAGRRHMWPIFWIYNLVWGTFGLVILIPLALVLAAVLLTKANPVVIIASVFIMIFVLIVAIVCGIVVGFWSDVAVVSTVIENLPARLALRRALEVFKQRIGDFAMVIGCRILAGILLQGVFSVYYAGTGVFSAIPVLGAALITAHIAVGLLHAVISLVVTAVFTAAIVGICAQQEKVHAVPA
jgi:hypothetical protein